MAAAGFVLLKPWHQSHTSAGLDESISARCTSCIPFPFPAVCAQQRPGRFRSLLMCSQRGGWCHSRWGCQLIALGLFVMPSYTWACTPLLYFPLKSEEVSWQLNSFYCPCGKWAKSPLYYVLPRFVPTSLANSLRIELQIRAGSGSIRRWGIDEQLLMVNCKAYCCFRPQQRTWHHLAHESHFLLTSMSRPTGPLCAGCADRYSSSCHQQDAMWQLVERRKFLSVSLATSFSTPEAETRPEWRDRCQAAPEQCIGFS